MVDIIFDNAGVEISAEEENTIRSAVECALKTENIEFDTEISVTLTDNEGIRGLNCQYRDIDRETDVLSFPMYEFETPAEFDEAELSLEPGAAVLGDIIISMEKVKEQALEYGHSDKRELSYLTVHSVMHLLGYDHMTDDDKTIMRAHEEAVMSKLGIQR